MTFPFSPFPKYLVQLRRQAEVEEQHKLIWDFSRNYSENLKIVRWNISLPFQELGLLFFKKNMKSGAWAVHFFNPFFTPPPLSGYESSISVLPLGFAPKREGEILCMGKQSVWGGKGGKMFGLANIINRPPHPPPPSHPPPPWNARQDNLLDSMEVH